MPLRAVSIEEFPGLDLRADPGDARGAIDAMNVTLERGTVRTRDGTVTFAAAVAGRPVFALAFPRATFNTTMAVGYWVTSSSDLRMFTSAGTLTGAATTLPNIGNGASGLIFGTPTNTYMYVTAPQAGLVRRWDGAVWTTPGTYPTATMRCLGLSPTDNRVALCEASKVWFSEPGAPETFSTANFVQLTPGDGESIMGTAVFNNQLFIFKNTKFFVFYGNSTDATGNPIFNYRVVNNAIGMSANGNPQSVCIAPDGVYFVGRNGVYRTTGGAPTCISDAVAPIFSGVYPTAASFWPTTQISLDLGSRIAWLRDKLYVSICTNNTTGDEGFTLVYDQQLKSWTAWDLHTDAMAVFTPDSSVNNEPTMMFGSVAVSGRQDPASVVALNRATPLGSAVSRYRLPFETYGNPGRKHLRETLLDGTGTPTVKWSKDWGALPTGSAVTLGTAPALGGGRQRLATLGNAFSLQLGAASGAWSVNRVQANIHDAIAEPEIG